MSPEVLPRDDQDAAVYPPPRYTRSQRIHYALEESDWELKNGSGTLWKYRIQLFLNAAFSIAWVAFWVWLTWYHFSNGSNARWYVLGFLPVAVFGAWVGWTEGRDRIEHAWAQEENRKLFGPKVSIKSEDERWYSPREVWELVVEQLFSTKGPNPVMDKRGNWLLWWVMIVVGQVFLGCLAWKSFSLGWGLWDGWWWHSRHTV